MITKMELPEKAIERFNTKWEPIPESGCWIWIGCMFQRTGYGQFHYKHHPYRAHRVSYIIHKGQIPEGMLVLHKCDVPCCVNPEHLYLGTHQDNANDMMRRGRNTPTVGEKHPNHRLKEKDIREIRKKYENGVNIMKLSNEYGVAFQHIYRIVTRERWKHV